MDKADMRVLQIMGEPIGGIRKHVHSILFGLSKDGIRQSYAYSTTAGDAVFKKELPGLAETLQGRLIPLSIRKRPSPSDILNVFKLIRYVKREGVTIVHGHGAKGGAYSRLLKIFCDVRTVYTPHGGAVHKMFGRFEEALYSTAEKCLLGLTDHFLFESNYSAQAYFEKVGRKPSSWSINYSGIPAPDIEALAAQSKALGYAPAPHSVPDIGVFGILRPQKGQQYALKAVTELIKKGIKVRLHFYGDGPDRLELERMVRDDGISDSVFFHGEVPDPEAHMMAMDIVLIPSLFEAFGYVAVEAFSEGKPVIASSVGGLCEIVQHGKCGFLIEPANPGAIADAVEQHLRQPELLKGYLSEAKNRFASMFDQERMIKKLGEVYQALRPAPLDREVHPEQQRSPHVGSER